MNTTATDLDPHSSPAGGGLKLGAVLLAVIAAGLAVAAGFLGPAVKNGMDIADRRAAIQAAARQEAINLINVDYRTAQQSSDRVLSGATGEFKDQWGGSVAQQFVDTLTKGQSVQTVQSVHVGIVNMTSSTAATLLTVSAVVTTPQVPGGAQRNYRISMELKRSGDRWLVSKFGLVP